MEYDYDTGHYACSCEAGKCDIDACPECAIVRMQDAKSSLYHLQDALYESQTKMPLEALREIENLAEILGADFILELNKQESPTAKIFSGLVEQYDIRGPHYG